MTANNGWPGKPGVPMHPERDGWHWMKTGHGVAPWLWRDDPQSITGEMGWETNEEVFAPGDIARVPGTTYLGPVLLPDEAAALQARADQAALGHAREADRADLSEFLHKQEIAALQKRVAELDGALGTLEKAASYTAKLGAVTGAHWLGLGTALIKARAALTGGKDE